MPVHSDEAFILPSVEQLNGLLGGDDELGVSLNFLFDCIKRGQAGPIET